MLGIPKRFIFNFDTVSQPILFPVPTTNQYQVISRLSYSPQTFQIIDKKWGNKVLVFPQNFPAHLSFSHQARDVIYDFDSIKVLKLNEPFSNDKYISSDSSELVSLNKKFIPKINVTNEQIVKHLYMGLLDYLEYGNPIDGLYTFSQALQINKVDCGGFATLLASLLKLNGIHSRLVVGYLFRKSKKNQLRSILKRNFKFEDITMHAWIEIPTNQGWCPLDPSIEWKRIHGQSGRQGGFGYTPNDRLVLSYGHNLSLIVNNKEYIFPILQHPEKLP